MLQDNKRGLLFSICPIGLLPSHVAPGSSTRASDFQVTSVPALGELRDRVAQRDCNDSRRCVRSRVERRITGCVRGSVEHGRIGHTRVGHRRVRHAAAIGGGGALGPADLDSVAAVHSVLWAAIEIASGITRLTGHRAARRTLALDITVTFTPVTAVTAAATGRSAVRSEFDLAV
jgi:hypothetical protein